MSVLYASTYAHMSCRYLSAHQIEYGTKLGFKWESHIYVRLGTKISSVFLSFPLQGCFRHQGLTLTLSLQRGIAWRDALPTPVCVSSIRRQKKTIKEMYQAERKSVQKRQFFSLIFFNFYLFLNSVSNKNMQILNLKNYRTVRKKTTIKIH